MSVHLLLSAGRGPQECAWALAELLHRLEATTFAEADVDVVACRTGGPGGQHRNKAGTAVRAPHRPTGLVVVVDAERQ